MGTCYETVAQENFVFIVFPLVAHEVQQINGRLRQAAVFQSFPLLKQFNVLELGKRFVFRLFLALESILLLICQRPTAETLTFSGRPRSC